MKYILRSETYEEVKLGTTLTYTNKEGKELEGFVQGIIWPFTNSVSNRTNGIIISQGTVVMNEKGYLRHYAPKDINLIWYKAGPSFQEFKDSYFYVDNMKNFMEHVLGVDHESDSYNAG